MVERRTRIRLIAVAAISAIILTGVYAWYLRIGRHRPPSREIGAAIAASDWTRIDAAASAWYRKAGFEPEGAVMRAYPALVEGDAAAAAKHFLCAQHVWHEGKEALWAESLGSRYPRSAAAQLLAGDALARNGRGQEAIKRFNAALRLDSHLYPARVARALLSAMKGDNRSAAIDLRSVRPTDASAADALVARALIRLQIGDRRGSLEDLERALKIAPEYAIAYNTRGILRSQQGDWASAAADFAKAFSLTPELVEARQNYQIVRSAKERGAAVSASYRLGVLATGINSEADFNYAVSHARYLTPGREPDYLYVAVKGALPPAGVDKMRDRGISTVVIDPKDPGAASVEADRFIRSSVAAGRNPVVLVDVNKWIPKQLGNNKPEALQTPADFCVRANQSFVRAVRERGGTSESTIAGHSDGSWIVSLASKMSSQMNTPVLQRGPGITARRAAGTRHRRIVTALAGHRSAAGQGRSVHLGGSMAVRGRSGEGLRPDDRRLQEHRRRQLPADAHREPQHQVAEPAQPGGSAQ